MHISCMKVLIIENTLELLIKPNWWWRPLEDIFVQTTRTWWRKERKWTGPILDLLTPLKEKIICLRYCRIVNIFKLIIVSLINKLRMLWVRLILPYNNLMLLYIKINGIVWKRISNNRLFKNLKPKVFLKNCMILHILRSLS